MESTNYHDFDISNFLPLITLPWRQIHDKYGSASVKFCFNSCSEIVAFENTIVFYSFLVML
jgi:hypothetical protein